MHTNARSHAVLHPPSSPALLALAALLLLTGCSADSRNPLRPMLQKNASRSVTPQSLAAESTDPAAAAAVERFGGAQHFQFYPLTIGNQWHYDTRNDLTVIASATGDTTVSLMAGTQVSTIDRIQSFDGRDYFVETHVQHTDGFVDLENDVIERQDRTGLYELDPVQPASPGRAVPSMPARPVLADPRVAQLRRMLGTRVSDASVAVFLDKLEHVTGAAYAAGAANIAPGGPLDHEITRLAYPLLPGSHWVIRDSPRFESTVESIGFLHEPAGWFIAVRIRIDSEFFGPDDRVHVWYGPGGFLKLAAHVVGQMTDDSGNIVGVAISDFGQDLTSLDLKSRFPHGPSVGALSPGSPAAAEPQ